MQKMIVWICLTIITLSGVAQSEARLKESDSGKTFTWRLKDKGSLISIEIPENASTGYTWRDASTQLNSVKHISKSYIAPENPMPGSGGNAVFTYELTGKPGMSKIVLLLIPPGGTPNDPAKVLIYNILVKKPQPKPVPAPQSETPAAPETQTK